MESAGAAVAEEIHVLYKEKKKRIGILVGPGNNGADGMVVARILKRKGFTNLRCIFVGKKETPSELWTRQWQKAVNSGVAFLSLSLERSKFELSECDLIVDAIFGTGLSKTLSEEVLALIHFVNERKTPVIAVDTPTGLNVDTGWEHGAAMKASVTVTFALAKPGFFVARGPRHVGKLKIHRIGFPTELLRQESGTFFAFGGKATRRLLPWPEETSNKADHGRVHVVAGSDEFPGAAVLVTRAAGRCGAGYVYLSSFSNLYREILQVPEVIFQPAAQMKFSRREENTVFVVGPGLGVNDNTKKIIVDLKRSGFENVVLDADALTVCSQENLWPLPKTWIITPHSGEMGRILSCTAAEVNANRCAVAMSAAKKCGCVVLLKGFRTVVADQEKAIVILAGNAALGKAGSGDVLAGFIGALRGQKMDAMAAACCAAYIHGRLADEWLKAEKDILALMPSDLYELVPTLLKKLRIAAN